MGPGYRFSLRPLGILEHRNERRKQPADGSDLSDLLLVGVDPRSVVSDSETGAVDRWRARVYLHAWFRSIRPRTLWLCGSGPLPGDGGGDVTSLGASGEAVGAGIHRRNVNRGPTVDDQVQRGNLGARGGCRFRAE